MFQKIIEMIPYIAMSFLATFVIHDFGMSTFDFNMTELEEVKWYVDLCLMSLISTIMARVYYQSQFKKFVQEAMEDSDDDDDDDSGISSSSEDDQEIQ